MISCRQNNSKVLVQENYDNSSQENKNNSIQTVLDFEDSDKQIEIQTSDTNTLTSKGYTGNGSEWKSELFKYDGSTYNKELAIVAGHMCKAADEDENSVNKLLSNYGFSSDDFRNYNYGAAVAHTVGHSTLYILLSSLYKTKMNTMLHHIPDILQFYPISDG